MDKPSELNIDIDRLAIVGDSAGGNAVAVINQRLLKEKLRLPKIQVLIYPWMQLFNRYLPSILKYEGTQLLAGSPVSYAEIIAWYLGISDMNDEIKNIIDLNQHALLHSDEDLIRIKKIFNINNIPKEFREDNSYYEDFESSKTDNTSWYECK